MVKFYHKYNPRVKIYLSNGAYVQFDTVDGQNGYFTTDNSMIISEFAASIQRKKGGIREITAQEFDSEFLKKKQSGMKPSRAWREEWGRGQSADTTAIKKTSQPNVSHVGGNNNEQTPSQIPQGEPFRPEALKQ